MDPRPRHKILIVDDDEDIRILIPKLLGNSQYDVFESVTLEDAFKKIKEHSPQLILLDINLNEASGFELLKQKKTDPLLKDCVIIMMSADSNAKNVKQAIMLGVDDFITKPIVNVTLARKIKKALRLITKG